MTFPSNEYPGKNLRVDDVGGVAEPICNCIADKKFDKADALLKRVPASQRKDVLTYIARYFPEWSPPVRQLAERECDFAGCSDTFIPERSTARFCPKHRRSRKPAS